MIESQEKCISLLEQLRWNSRPRCPYCESIKSAKLRKEQRYHCSSCYTSYSVTVGTIFHKTHIKLPQWFQAIELTIHKSPNISARKLAIEIGVNKNTAASMLKRIRRAAESEEELLFLKKILEVTSKTRKQTAYSTPDMIPEEI